MPGIENRALLTVPRSGARDILFCKLDRGKCQTLFFKKEQKMATLSFRRSSVRVRTFDPSTVPQSDGYKYIKKKKTGKRGRPRSPIRNNVLLKETRTRTRPHTKYSRTRMCTCMQTRTCVHDECVYTHGDVCKYTIVTRGLSIHCGEIQSYRLPTSKYFKCRNSLFTFDFPRPKGFIRKSNPSDRRTLIRVRVYVSVFFPPSSPSECTRRSNKQRFDVNKMSFVCILFYNFFKSIAKIRSPTNAPATGPRTTDAFIQLKY